MRHTVNVLVQEFKCRDDKNSFSAQYIHRRYCNHFDLKFSCKVYTGKKFSSLKTVHVTDVSLNMRETTKNFSSATIHMYLLYACTPDRCKVRKKEWRAMIAQYCAPEIILKFSLFK